MTKRACKNILADLTGKDFKNEKKDVTVRIDRQAKSNLTNKHLLDGSHKERHPSETWREAAVSHRCSPSSSFIFFRSSSPTRHTRGRGLLSGVCCFMSISKYFCLSLKERCSGPSRLPLDVGVCRGRRQVTPTASF